MLRNRFTLLVTMCMLTSTLCATPGNDPSQTSDIERPYSVEIVGPESTSLAYGDPIVITAIITAHSDIELSDTSIRPLGILADVYNSNDATCVIGGSSKATTNASIVATCQLASTPGLRFWRPSAWFIPPGKQHLAFEIPTVDESANRTPYFENVSISFKAPLDAIFIGGLAGAFLLAIFFAVEERVQTPITQVVVKDWQGLKNLLLGFLGWMLVLPARIWKVALQTIMGGICALILILIAQGTEGASPPIAIKIQDFWGGVVVGLLSIPVSQWILDRVRPRNGAADIEPEKETSQAGSGVE